MYMQWQMHDFWKGGGKFRSTRKNGGGGIRDQLAPMLKDESGQMHSDFPGLV